MSKITRRCAVCIIARSTHAAFSRSKPSSLASCVRTPVSNRLMALALAAGLSTPRSPTITPSWAVARIVGLVDSGLTVVNVEALETYPR